jgi:hypothetical protein
MKRSLFSGMGLASAVLSLGLSGCGGSGVEEGAPSSLKPDVIIDPSMTDVTGKMGPGAARKAQAEASKAQAAAKAQPATPSDEPK